MNYVGPLPPQREGQYQTMTICGTSDDPAERGHWSSPAHVQWRIDKAVAEERERWKLVRNLLARIHRDGGHYVEEHGLDKALCPVCACVRFSVSNNRAISLHSWI